MTAPDIASGGTALYAALFRLAEIYFAAYDAFIAVDVDDAAAYAACHEAYRIAVVDLTEGVRVAGYTGSGWMPPLRGADGRRVLIRYRFSGKPDGFAVAYWLADHDIDLQIACQVQAVQRTAKTQEATV